MDCIVRNDEVVGSIPTSSTIFSSTCRPLSRQSCHTLSHKSEPARRELPQTSPRGGASSRGRSYFCAEHWPSLIHSAFLPRLNLMAATGRPTTEKGIPLASILVLGRLSIVISTIFIVPAASGSSALLVANRSSLAHRNACGVLGCAAHSKMMSLCPRAYAFGVVLETPAFKCTARTIEKATITRFIFWSSQAKRLKAKSQPTAPKLQVPGC